MANIEEDKIEYLNVQILKTEITNDTQNPLTKVDTGQIKYSIKATDLYNIEKQLVRVIMDISIIISKEADQLDAGARFEIDNYFRYPDLKEVAQIEKDRVLIDSKFAEVVKGLAYSTARGITISKLAGTFLEKAILPVKMSTDV